MNVARYVVGFLQSRGLVRATAESCTAGLIASQFAEVPASGACLDVGFVVYSPSGKSGFLRASLPVFADISLIGRPTVMRLTSTFGCATSALEARTPRARSF